MCWDLWNSTLKNLNAEPSIKAAAKFIHPNLREELSEASVVTELVWVTSESEAFLSAVTDCDRTAAAVTWKQSRNISSPQTAVCLLRKTYFWYFKWTSCIWVWLDLVSSNWAPQGNRMFYMLSDKNVFRELLCQHWNFNSLFSPGNRRELLTHAVMFSGAVFHRKARASTDFYMWSSLNAGELQQCLQNLLLTLSSFTKGSIANCSHFVKFGWKENILLVFIRAQNSFWKPACLSCSERGSITIDSVPSVAKISSQSLCELLSDSGTAVWGPMLQTQLHFPLLFLQSQCLVPSLVLVPFPLQIKFKNWH